MEDVTICRVINKNDDSWIRIFTEWLENGIKITIFSSDSGTQPLVGEMKSSDIEIFAKNLSKTRSEYLDGTRLVLSGRDPGVDFVLKDEKLRWKRGAWNHGMVEVGPAPLAQVFPSVLNQLLARQEDLDRLLTAVRAENEELKASRNRLEDETEQMIKTKNELEAVLYKRFAVVLNSKKARIRELDEELRRRSGSRGEDPYEAQTDDSGASDSGEDGVEKAAGRKPKRGEQLLKRQIEDTGQKTSSHDAGEDKTEENRNERKKPRAESNMKSNEESGGAPSTSGNVGIEPTSTESRRPAISVLVRRDFDVATKHASLINFTSEDSEEDLFS